MYRILYVDDEPALLEIGKLFLEQSGQFIVDTCTSAPAALTLVNTTHYDAIISDYQMPGMDGIEFLKSVRCSATTLPFILFTGRGREEVVIQALNEGADFYIQKGGEPKSQFAELSNKIRYAVVRRSAERELLQKNEDLNAAYEELTATDESLRQSYDELSKKEEAIRASEEKFRAVVELSLDAVFITDFSGNLLFANPALGTILDVADYRTLKGTRNVMEFLAPESREKIKVDFGLVSRGIDHYLVHYKIITDQKREAWVECVGKKIAFERSDAILVSMRDVTERKVAEEALVKKNEELNASYEQIAASEEELRSGFDELTRQEMALRESERRFRELADLLPMVVFEADLQGTLTYVNRIGYGFYGCTDDDIRKGLNVTQMLAPGDRERAAASLRAVVEGTKKPEPGQEYMARRMDGSTFPIAIYSSPIVVDGRTTGFRGIVADISEYKQAYAALHESEEKYRELVENANSIILKWDRSGNITFFNEFAQRFFGYSGDEIIGKPVVGTIVPAIESGSGRNLGDLIDDIIRHPDDHIFNENENITRDGKRVWIRWQNKPVFDTSGQFAGQLCIGTDMTDRKRADEILLQSQERLEIAMNAAGLGIWTWDLTTNERRIYLGRQTILGFTEAEIEEYFRTFELRQHPEEKEKWGGIPTRIRTSQAGMTNDFEMRILGKDGAWKTLQVKGSIVRRDMAGNPRFLIGTFQDITARKDAEEALRESEERYRNVVEDQTEFISRFLPDGTHVFVNEAYCRYFGLKRDEILMHKFRPKIPPEDRERMNRFFTSLSRDHPVDIIEHRIIMPDGSIRWQRWSDRAIFNPSGTITGYQSVGRDVTDYKSAEMALKENRRLLAEAMDLANMVSWEWDPATGVLTFDDRFPALYGTNAEQKDSSHMTAEAYLRELVHPEDLGILLDEDEKLRNTTDPHYTARREYRIIRRDGEVRHIEMCVGVTKDESGRTIKVHGVNQDITERKRAGESLAQANRKLTLLASISRHDINNQLLTLRGFLDLLHRNVSDPALEHYFSRMATASDSISAMIRFTREYESIGVNAPAWQEVSLLADSSSKDISFGQIRLINDIPHGIEVYADPLIGRVFFNLMDNAVRHGGKITTIRFSVEEQDDRHIVVCEDDGDGIVAEEKEQIFDRGFGKNTGIGLFLAREILSITGIGIHETGEPGKGARFGMTVPTGAWRVSGKK